jgi:predicted TIM-barrel fold metal-dependent hydrolase
MATPEIIDGDSHFMEPFDLWLRYIDPAYRDRCIQFPTNDARTEIDIVVEGNVVPRSESLSTLQLFGVATGYGQKEHDGRRLGEVDTQPLFEHRFEDMGERLRFLDREGFQRQYIFPTLGLVWEGLIEDPALAAAHCRVYNRWALEVTADHSDRLLPFGHVSLRDPVAAVKELEFLSDAGVRGVFIAALAPDGRSLGNLDFDPIWDCAAQLEMGIGLHLVVHPHYLGSDWIRDRDPGFMFLSMNCIQDPRMALTTMVYDGVFERFPNLYVATVEAASGWVVEWIDRLDYRFSYMGHTCQMGRPASETFETNIWVSADPHERTLPFTVELLGDHKFFTGSDFPHLEGFTDPVKRTRETLAALSSTSVDRILGPNAADFLRLS